MSTLAVRRGVFTAVGTSTVRITPRFAPIARTMSGNATQATEVPTFGFKEKTPSAEEKALLDDMLQLCECTAKTRSCCTS